MNYIEEYLFEKERFETKKDNIEKEVAELLSQYKSKYNQDLFIGNMVYTSIFWNDTILPAYCYKSDYKGNNPPFYPIYDRDMTGEFGWMNFSECCRIFDVIKKYMLTKC